MRRSSTGKSCLPSAHGANEYPRFLGRASRAFFSSASGCLKEHVQEDTDRESRRDSPAGDLRPQRAGDSHRGHLQRSRPQFASCPFCRRSHLHRASATGAELSQHPLGDQRGGNRQRGRHPSRLRPAGGKCQLRGSRRNLQHQVHRAAAGNYAADGRKRKSPRRHEEGWRTHSARIGRHSRQRWRSHGVGEEDLPALFKAAQSEAAASFGNGDLYMEKFVERPRHIEFQILADQYGNVVSLGERECSIQRRHQKLLEESPSTQMSPDLRDQIGQVLCKTLSEIGYVNAGTIEFLMDEDRKLYFIEMNTRIQVEHPVTEMVTDVDLVKSQILLAAGERMESVLHGPVLHRGHAIECRINAEHPEKFTPSAGRITTFNPPGGTGVRIDTAAYAEGVIPPYYDSLIAKLIVRGKDRAEAVSRMARALEMFIIEGIYTTIPLHRRILV